MNAAVWIALTLFLAQTASEADPPLLAPINPTPQAIVERMLQLGGLRAGEEMCDLGSGDGRIVITAARKFHAYALGVEIDDELYRESTEQLRKLGLSRSARIIRGDLLKQRYGSCDVVTVYLEQSSEGVIAALLERELKKGARVVSHNFELRGWRPRRVESIDDAADGKPHTLYLYER